MKFSGEKLQELRHTLDALYDSRSEEHLANDPLSFCHRYNDPADREIAALIAASFAYGSVKVIKKSLARIFEGMGESLSGFVDTFDPATQKSRFESFRHRFNDGRDLCCLFWALKIMRKRSGSIEQFFLDSSADQDNLLEKEMGCFSSAILAIDYSPVTGTATLPPEGYFKFLFPSPSGGSACKRLCMFLRWVARPADGIDLGLWQKLSPSRLYIPVDVHISRIARYLGLTARTVPDWKMAREITESLRLLAPDDPVKYDFSICHIGISEGCDGKADAACSACPISGHCSVCSG